jgi:integrase
LLQLDLADTNRTEALAATVAIRILLYTGMRYGEVMTLKWSHVDLQHKCFRLPDTKTGSRIIPFGVRVLDSLGTLERSASELVLAGRKADAPISLRRPWYRIRKSAEIDESATLHTLRHTFASWSVMGGLSLAQVGSMLGHKSAQTTLRYADHAMEAVRAYNEKTSDTLAAMTKVEREI